MNNLYVKCESLEQRQDVFDVLTTMGYKSDGNDEHYLSVQTYAPTGLWYTWILSETLDDTEKLTYTKFMEKYGNTMNKFKETVEKAKAKLNINNSELSRMLGYHRDYINEALKDGRSTKWQESTIAKVEGLLNGEVLVDKDEIITQLKKDKEQLVIHNGKLVEEIGQVNAVKDELQKDKVELVNQFNLINEDLSKTKKQLVEKSMELGSCLGEVGGLKQDKDSLKGQIRSLEKINAQYKNKYAVSVTIGLIVIAVLIFVNLVGGF